MENFTSSEPDMEEFDHFNLTFREQVSELGDTLYNEDISCSHYRMARRILRRQLQNEGKILPIYIVAQGISRYYIGPQEGGAWGDWHRIIEVRKAWDWKTALRYLHEMKADNPPPRYSRGSVLGGEDICFTITHDPSDFPEESTKRETYE